VAAGDRIIVLGKFITFEGGEGSGKSTQARLLSEQLCSVGVDTLVTREPGGSPFAEALRQVILNPEMPAHSSLSEALLFYSARADHLDNTVRPALNTGVWVICDRFIDSTRVYQGEAGGLPGEIIDVLNHMVVSPTFPDLTIILDLPAELGLGRAHSRRVDRVNPDTEADAYEKRDLAFHWKLREAFCDIARAEPERCVLIDATLDERAVFAAVWRAVETRLLALAR
jgi:dTMP kinase